MNKVTRYMITNTDNSGHRRFHGKEFKTKSEAQIYLKKLLAPAKVNAYGVRLTAYRDALSGTGINNPRIRKMRVLR